MTSARLSSHHWELKEPEVKSHMKPSVTACRLNPGCSIKHSPPEELLPLLTINGACAAFQEGIKGSLAPGKLADLVALSESPLARHCEAIADMEVLVTTAGAQVAYCADAVEPGIVPIVSRSRRCGYRSQFGAVWDHWGAYGKCCAKW
jgi:hypothetical protein